MSVINSIRIYDLAREVKQNTKRIIEDLRGEGADVSLPSNFVSKEFAEKIRNKYLPTVETAPKQIFKVDPSTGTVRSSIKIIPRVKSSIAIPPTTENKTDIIKTQPKVEGNITHPSLEITEKMNEGLSAETLINSKKENSNNILVDEFKVDCRECLRPTKHNLIHSTNSAGVEWDEKYQIVQCLGSVDILI